MRILLSDGAGLTARQCATLLSGAGHEVEALSAEPLCLCRFTRHVRKVHQVPPCGIDPFGWLDAACWPNCATPSRTAATTAEAGKNLLRRAATPRRCSR